MKVACLQDGAGWSWEACVWFRHNGEGKTSSFSADVTGPCGIGRHQETQDKKYLRGNRGNRLE